MKPSQFYTLVAIMYVAPHMEGWVAAGAFIFFAIMAVCCMYGEKK